MRRLLAWPMRTCAWSLVLTAAASMALLAAVHASGVSRPHDHVFGGHAAWHALTALSLVFYERFQRQFLPEPARAASAPATAFGAAATEP